MAKKALSGKNLILDSVRVTYDEKTDSIHVTAKDKDFEQGDSFHIVLNKGTKTEDTLRKALCKYSLMPEDRINILPSHADFEKRYTENDNCFNIPLGLLRDGTEFEWNVKSTPNMFIMGTTGSGKSVLERIILRYLSEYPSEWELYGVDLKRVELTEFKSNGHLQDLATNLNDACELFAYFEKELWSRYELMEEANVNNIDELTAKPKRILLLVDEMSELTAKVDEKSVSRDSDLEYDIHRLEREIQRKKIIRSLSTISRLGRASGIHLALFSQRMIDDDLKEVRDNVGLRIVMGRVSKSVSEDLMNSEIASTTAQVRGRGVFNNYGKVDSFQSYYTQHDSKPE